ncbi:MAG: hypothetical protein ACR2HN_13675 [Tepidiformaceae bacterium]
MSGIFYDPHGRRLRVVQGPAEPGWLLVTHNVQAGTHQCRRILREWLAPADLINIDWSGVDVTRSG